MEKLHFPSGESLTLLLTMVFVVPFTYKVIRILLEDKMDFDLIINRKLLRFIELFIAMMLFPSAAMYILCLLVYKLLVAVFHLSCWLVSFLGSLRLLSDLFYYLASYVMFLALMIGVIALIQHILPPA